MRNKIRNLANVEGGDVPMLILPTGFGEEVSVALDVVGEVRSSCIHSLLQSDGESTDLERLFSLLGWVGFLQAQISETIGDEVKFADGDLARLDSFQLIAKVEDDSHLKHKLDLYTKGAYLARQLSELFAPAILRQHSREDRIKW
jgi:hypothetical protein